MLKSLVVRGLTALTLALALTPLRAAESGEAVVRAAVESLVPGARIEGVSKSALPGFHEVLLGGQIIYVSDDGKYLLSGSVWDVSRKKDLTDARRATLRRTALSQANTKPIVFSAKQHKHTVTVFTDIDCGYCRKLHQDMTAYNDLGITVQYLFFPRAGLNSESYNKAVSVWCAADQQQAMTAAKSSGNVESKTCPNPISEEFALGQKIGVSGTPAVIAEDGTQIGGYLTPEQMIARLDQLKTGGGN
jgi:thiol:disulfide interchange protein DsbC